MQRNTTAGASSPLEKAPVTRPVGLVGGLGPAATAIYYRRLLAAAEATSVTLDLLVSHADVAVVLAHAVANDRAALAKYLHQHLSRLVTAGAEVLAIAAVTPHLVAPELRLDYAVIDVMDALDAELAVLGGSVALIGTRTVTGTALFGRLTTPVITPRADLIDAAHAAYVQVVDAQGVDDALAAELRSIAQSILADTGADRLVLAGTDLALAPPPTWAGLPVVDCTPLHVHAILRAAIRPSGYERTAACRSRRRHPAQP